MFCPNCGTDNSKGQKFCTRCGTNLLAIDRAREIITELEPCPRGLYTGAIGFLGANGESHFNIVIEAEAFQGAAKVARQRMVYKALAEELAGPVHALSVKALAPGEA